MKQAERERNKSLNMAVFVAWLRGVIPVARVLFS